MTLQYRGASDVSRLDGTSAFYNTERLNPSTEAEFYTTTLPQGDYNGGPISGGTNTVAPASGTVTKNHPGVWRMQSSTTANSGYYLNVGVSQLLIGGGEIFTFVFQTPAAFTNLTLRFGFLDTITSAAPTDGAFFAVGSTGIITGNTTSNATTSATPTIATLSTSAWYHARITVNATATSVLFELFNDAGASLGSQSLTGNIPTATGRETGAGFCLTSAGTTAADLLVADFIQIGYTNARTRGALTGL